MEDIQEIRRILNIPLNNLSIDDFKIIGKFLMDCNDISIVKNEFNGLIHYFLLDIYYDNFVRTKKKTFKSFKTDTCVIYLSKDPNVLFCNCRHICICLECEEIDRLVGVHIVRLIFQLKQSFKYIIDTKPIIYFLPLTY